MEPSKKVKAKNLAKRGPKFFKIQKIQILNEDKKNYNKKNTFCQNKQKNFFTRSFFGFWWSSKRKKSTNKRTKYFFVCFSKKCLFCFNFSYPHLEFWNFWILKNFGPLFAKILELTYLEGSKNLAYNFNCCFWAYMWI